MVQISQKIFALDEIFNLDFDKFPLASFYNDYPFLIIEDFFTKQECKDIINSLNKNENYKAKLISKESLNENIRKTIHINQQIKLDKCLKIKLIYSK